MGTLWEYNKHLLWIKDWTDDILAGTCLADDISRRLKRLLDQDESSALSDPSELKAKFGNFLWYADWTPRADKFDNIWNGIFGEAGRRGWTYEAREALFCWAEANLGKTASDYELPDEDDEVLEEDPYADYLIAASLGSARLFSLGYTYSAFAFARLSDGLGLSPDDDDSKAHDPRMNSDSKRIAACAQLLAGGRRLRLHFNGGGDEHIEGTARAWLAAAPKEEWTDEIQAVNDRHWAQMMDALSIEQGLAGPQASKLLQTTLQHMQSNKEDLTSEEVAALVWPGKQFGPIAVGN